MRGLGKITKSEIFLLAVTLVFLALVLVLHVTGKGGDQKSGYTVRAQQMETEPEEELKRIDLNTADTDTLQRLPGIGPALAERIVKDRAANGPFATVDDLTRVEGIGEKTVEAIRPYVTVELQGEEAEREDSGR